MSEKIWEDIYQTLKTKWWGTPLIVTGLVVVVAFSFWNSLPDSTKEKLIISENNKQTINQSSKSIEIEKSEENPEIPDLGRAIRTTQATSSDMLEVSNGEVTDVSPSGFKGYFRLLVGSSEHVYSSSSVLLNQSVEPNLFISSRVAPGSGMSTLEIKGLDVWFLLDAVRNKYMIYNSEENQTYWKDLPSAKDQYWNTIGIHQVGRDINVFLNSNYIDTFKLWNNPKPGKVGLYYKAKPSQAVVLLNSSVYQFTSSKVSKCLTMRSSGLPKASRFLHTQKNHAPLGSR